MHGIALAGVTMSVLIRCLSPLGTHGTEWRREGEEREGVPAVHSREQQKERRSRGESQVNCDSQ